MRRVARSGGATRPPAEWAVTRPAVGGATARGNPRRGAVVELLLQGGLDRDVEDIRTASRLGQEEGTLPDSPVPIGSPWTGRAMRPESPSAWGCHAQPPLGGVPIRFVSSCQRRFGVSPINCHRSARHSSGTVLSNTSAMLDMAFEAVVLRQSELFSAEAVKMSQKLIAQWQVAQAGS